MVYGISVGIDGSEDSLIHCIKPGNMATDATAAILDETVRAHGINFHDINLHKINSNENNFYQISCLRVQLNMGSTLMKPTHQFT